MVKKYYKVVEDMHSLYANGADTIVTYIPNEWVEPQLWAKEKRLGLWVCNTLASAYDIAAMADVKCQIWECEIDEIVRHAYVEYGIRTDKIRPDSHFHFSTYKEKRYTCAMKVKLTVLVG